MSEVQTTEAVVVHMPESPEQLRAFVAATLTEVLSIPENQVVQAETLLTTLLGLVRDKRMNDKRAQLRPVVVSTYYRGAIKAEVVLVEGTAEFGVRFFEESKNAEGGLNVYTALVDGTEVKRPIWVPAKITEVSADMLSKTVLSQLVRAGDEYYITTSAAIEAHMEMVTDMVMGQDTIVQSVEETLPATPAE